MEMQNTECRHCVYCSIILSLLVAALLVMGGCANPEKTKTRHLTRGEAFLKEEKYQEASLEFRNALQIDDKLARAHWGLARAYEGLQRFQEAFDEMRRTIELDPNNLEARIKLGNYYIAVAKNQPGAVADAERLAREVLEKDPENIEGHILLGSVLFGQDQRDKAFAELNHAIELDPKRVESYLSLARFYIVTNDQNRAEETFKRAISINDASTLAHSEYGKYLVQINRPVEAEAQLKKAVEVEPNNRNSRFVLASFYLVNKQLDKAEEAYKALASLDRKGPEGRAALADFYSATNRLDDAIGIYQDILGNSPDYVQGHYRLGEIMLMKGDVKAATAQADEVLKKDQQDRQALLLRARIRSQSGQTADLKAAIDDLKEVLRQDPNSRGGLYFMAQTNFSLGLVDQARAFAGDLERIYPDYLPARLMQVQINLAAGDAKTALRLASELLDRLGKAAPDRDTSPQMLAELRAKTYVAKGSAEVQLGNTETARQDFATARDAAPKDPAPLINLAIISVIQNKPDEAIGLYDKALLIDATNFSALDGLIKVYARQNQLGKAHTRLDQVISAYPNTAWLHFLKAQIYGFEHSVQGAEAELRTTLELDPTYVAAYSALGALFVNTKQEDRAIAEYRKIIERRPDNAPAYTLIGMLEDARKNYDAAADNYRKALEYDGNAAIAANNLAWLYAVQGKGNLDEAVRLAQGVVQKYPNIAGFVDTLGWIYYKKGLYVAAIEQLQKAVSVDETAAERASSTPSPNYHYHLGMALGAKGDKEAARRELGHALRLGEKVSFADADEARKALATL
jgi:tetratricopeptide (TPR) repeat protein